MKKILRLLKRRNNGGFTLVEVIISCALLGHGNDNSRNVSRYEQREKRERSNDSGGG